MVSKERNYGIDLLKIISMIMIVMMHILTQGGVIKNTTAFSADYEILWLIKTAAYCAVDCFALASGFVGIDAEYNYSRIVRLWGRVLQYSVIITGLFLIAMPDKVMIKDLIKAFLPVSSNSYWYFTAYFCMFFFMPAFNYLVNNAGEGIMKKIIYAIIVLLSVYPTIINKDLFGTLDGYGFLWLSSLYIIGAYIKKYGSHLSGLSKMKLALIYTGAVLTGWLSRVVIEYIGYRVLDNSKWQAEFMQRVSPSMFISYTSPLMLACAVVLLALFSKIKIRHGKNIILSFSAASFSVYLIHTHPLVFEYILKDSFSKTAEYNIFIMLLLVILFPIIIYAACACVEIVRSRIIEKIISGRHREKKICIDNNEK